MNYKLYLSAQGEELVHCNTIEADNLRDAIRDAMSDDSVHRQLMTDDFIFDVSGGTWWMLKDDEHVQRVNGVNRFDVIRIDDKGNEIELKQVLMGDLVYRSMKAKATLIA